MPTPSAYGSTFRARSTSFPSAYSAGNIDVGVAGVYVYGWIFSTGSGNSTTNADPATGRPGSVTVGGTALTLGAPQDRNILFGAASGGWVAEVFGFLPGKTGLQAVVANQVTGGGAPSTSGNLWVDLQVYNDAVTVPVKTAIPHTAASGNTVSTAFTSAAGRLDVMSTHTSMSPSSGSPMTASAVAPSVLRSAAAPLTNAAVIADRPSAASSTLAVNTTLSFGFAFIGTQLSLAGSAPAGPTIGTQPTAQTVNAGQTANFNVVGTAIGGGVLSYAWRDDGAPIGGAPNSANFSISATYPDNGSQISVAVTETGGSSPGTTVSSNALLTVNAVAPTVSTHPANQTVAAGGTASFTAAFAGNPTPTVQWRRGGVAISGATSLTYSFSAVSGDNGATFDCVATNPGGSVTTNTATLTVSTGVTYGFDFHTLAGCRLTSFAGSGAALNSEVGTQVVATAHNPTTGALVATSGTLTADSNSRLPRWANAALAAATVYVVLLWPQDGRQPYAVRVTTT